MSRCSSVLRGVDLRKAAVGIKRPKRLFSLIRKQAQGILLFYLWLNSTCLVEKIKTRGGKKRGKGKHAYCRADGMYEVIFSPQNKSHASWKRLELSRTTHIIVFHSLFSIQS